MAAQDLVGQRIKAIRRQRGLSQAQLAHPELSDSYVSLIESGKRTPTPAVLELLAQKLDCSLTYLVNGVTAEQMEDLEVGLSFARMALENGEVAEARRRYAELLADSNLLGLTAPPVIHDRAGHHNHQSKRCQRGQPWQNAGETWRDQSHRSQPFGDTNEAAEARRDA